MKKFFLGFLALLLSATLFAAPRTLEQAAEIAAQFTNSQPQLSRMHKAPRKAANMRLAHKALQNNSETAAFYVFNQEGNNGFVIVSADDRTADEVLGYSENGSFNFENINPNFRWWLSRYVEEITILQTIDDSDFIDEPAPRKAKQVTAIPNLLVNSDNKEITWDQLTPYNNLCPTDQRDNTKCYTGCVATATSQIMYKWRWPKKGTGSSSYTWKNCKNDDCSSYTTKQLSANYGNTTYDWDNMLPAYSGKNYTTAQANAVATLMSHAGIAAEMSYGGDENGGSGAWTDNMAYGLMTYFGYKFDKFITMYSKASYGDVHEGVTAEYSVSRDKFTEYFNTDLEAGRPILMGGEDSKNGGHEFVCCGRDANNKFYINWGWEGDGNGYFAISSLKPSGTSYNFSTNLDAIIGLEPKEAGHAVVTNGTGCTITPSANFAANDEAFTATITPTDETYDFTSITVKLGSTTLTKTTHYTLSSDNKTLTIKASAITGDYSNDLTITAVWTKNRYKYEFFGENCDPEMGEGTLAKNAALNLTITPASGYTLSDAECWDVEMGGKTLTYGTGFTYNGTTFSIASVTGDVSILAYGGKQTTWMSQGEIFATTLTSADKYVLPANNPVACQGKVFVGWCATENYQSATTAPEFIKAGDSANKGNILYAVFATDGGGSGTTNVTYTASSLYSNEEAAGSKVVDGVTFAYAKGGNTQNEPKYYTNGTSVRMYANNTLTISAASAITAIQFTYGGTTADFTANVGTLNDNKWSGNSESIVFTAAGKHYIQAIMVTVGSGTAYSNYSTSCDGGTPVATTYTIRFFNNGEQIGADQEVTAGQQAQKPTNPTPACDSYTFVGWWTAELATDNTDAKAWITNFTATQDQDYYAVFSKSETSGGSAVTSIEKANSIAVDDEVILVCESKKTELTSFSSSSTVYGIGSEYTTTPSGEYSFTVVEGKNSGTYAFVRDGKYWNWSSGNSLSTATSLSDNSSWTVSFSEGDATIKNAKDNTRIIQWNAGSPRFACYTTTQTKVQLYKKVTTGGSVSTTYYTTTQDCGGTPQTPVAVTGVTLDKSEATLQIGGTVTLTATVVPANADNKSVNWTSSDNNVATVANGVVTAVAAGNATITVKTVDGNYTATCAITVKAATPVIGNIFTLVTNDANLREGDKIIIVASKNNDSYAATLETGSSSSSAWLTDANVTVTDNTVTVPTETELAVLTLGGTSEAWTFTNANSQLLGSAAVKKVDWNKGTTTWTIQIDDDYNASIYNTDENCGRILYNVNNPRFTTYTSDPTVSMLLPQIFSYRPTATNVETTITENKAVKLIENGQIVIICDNCRYTIFGQKIQ